MPPGRPDSQRVYKVVLFGDTGCGKSSIINLLADKPVANVATGVESCTSRAEWFPISIGEKTFRLWDTMGFNQPEAKDINPLPPYKQAHTLLRNLKGGIDLILLCTRKDRINVSLGNLYWLLNSFFFHGQAQIALILTHFDVPDPGWWDRNVHTVTQICGTSAQFIPHACITTTQDKSSLSSQTLRALLQEHAVSPTKLPNLSSDATIEDVAESLSSHCQLNLLDAKVLAEHFRSPTRPFRAIFFGETGAGKSSVINLTSGSPVARVSAGMNNCTPSFCRYEINTGMHQFLVWDTVGLYGTFKGKDATEMALKDAARLARDVHDEGGVDVLVFCKKKGRFLPSELNCFRLFHEFLCGGQVPIAFIITHLEAHVRMEEWWEQNGEDVKKVCELSAVAGHACITAARDDPCDQGLCHKRSLSRQLVHTMLENSISHGNASKTQGTPFLKRLVGVDKGNSTRKEKIYITKLMNRCGLTRGQAELFINFQDPETALKDTIAKLHSELADAKQKTNTLDKIVCSLRADLEVQNAKSSMSFVDRELSMLNRTSGRSCSSVDFEKTINELHTQLSDSRQNTQQISTELANSKQVIHTHRQKHECEKLYASGRITSTAKSLLEITKSINDDLKSDAVIMDWLPGFTSKCLAALEQIGDMASRTGKDDEALAAYATALSLCPSNNFLNKWVSIILLHGSTDEVLDGARELELPEFAVYQAICDVLEGDGRITEAIRCFGQIQSELAQAAADIGNERTQWKVDFQRRCAERLEKLAEAASQSQNYAEADKLYSSILSLDPPDRASTLIKRSHARAMMKSWEDALMDADEVVKLEPSSHAGYERRHAALHGARRHAEAVAAFDTMLSKLQPPALRSQYPNARRTIRAILRATISHMPRVLIDTATGHLCYRTQLAEAFEALPIFNELVSSMTQEIDYVWIQREVDEFCGYVMFSHKWEQDEPLFQKVMHVTVYKLEASRGNIKLQTFCSIVRSLGFRWAWSDTCCIDKSDNVVLQESLVAMFPWYRNSSLTIVHLLGVSSLLEELSEEPNDLRESIWNSRVWTYQEYVAAKRVLFYTDDWKPYLGLTLENHKESPIILRQMEMPEVSSEQVAVLQPGLDRVREKLYLASTRETTYVEDIAYSLLGVLNAPISIMYGEGTRAVGRLLEYVLTGSGDATILAWTGTANNYNSCLPVNLAVYETVVPPHVPHMETAELDCAVTALCSSTLDYSLTAVLYDELNKHPPPTISSSRLRLSVILSCVRDVDTSGADAQTYRATTDLFGDIEIKTASDLAMMGGLCLVHPWIRPLLDQEFNRGSTRLDLATQALRLVARLQQPFGALLFEQVSRTEYKRVAADTLVMVQLREDVSLTDLINNVRTIEIL